MQQIHGGCRESQVLRNPKAIKLAAIIWAALLGSEAQCSLARVSSGLRALGRVLASLGQLGQPLDAGAPLVVVGTRKYYELRSKGSAVDCAMEHSSSFELVSFAQ